MECWGILWSFCIKMLSVIFLILVKDQQLSYRLLLFLVQQFSKHSLHFQYSEIFRKAIYCRFDRSSQFFVNLFIVGWVIEFVFGYSALNKSHAWCCLRFLFIIFYSNENFNLLLFLYKINNFYFKSRWTTCDKLFYAIDREQGMSKQWQ